MTTSIFDPAIFDPAIFDTAPTVCIFDPAIFDPRIFETCAPSGTAKRAIAPTMLRPWEEEAEALVAVLTLDPF